MKLWCILLLSHKNYRRCLIQGWGDLLSADYKNQITSTYIFPNFNWELKHLIPYSFLIINSSSPKTRTKQCIQSITSHFVMLEVNDQRREWLLESFVDDAAEHIQSSGGHNIKVNFPGDRRRLIPNACETGSPMTWTWEMLHHIVIKFIIVAKHISKNEAMFFVKKKLLIKVILMVIYNRLWGDLNFFPWD